MTDFKTEFWLAMVIWKLGCTQRQQLAGNATQFKSASVPKYHCFPHTISVRSFSATQFAVLFNDRFGLSLPRFSLFTILSMLMLCLIRGKRINKVVKHQRRKLLLILTQIQAVLTAVTKRIHQEFLIIVLLYLLRYATSSTLSNISTELRIKILASLIVRASHIFT